MTRAIPRSSTSVLSIRAGCPYEEKDLVKQLSEIGHFLRALRIQMRFGKLSRAPLRLLRFEWRGESAACDWLARPADEWDADLPRQVSGGNVSEQALRDAITVRELLFSVLPGVDTASLRVFRQPAGRAHELIITGTVTRGEVVPRKVSSVAMRAKLLRFQFWFEDGILEALQSEECAMSF
jgi:hypothetical protein